MNGYLIFGFGMVAGGCVGLLLAAALGGMHREPEPPLSWDDRAEPERKLVRQVKEMDKGGDGVEVGN